MKDSPLHPEETQACYSFYLLFRGMEERLFKRLFGKAVDTVFKQILKFSASFLKYMFCSVNVYSLYVAFLLCIRHPYRSPCSKQAPISPWESVAEFSPECWGVFVGQSHAPQLIRRVSQALNSNAFGLVPRLLLWCSPACLAALATGTPA